MDDIAYEDVEAVTHMLWSQELMCRLCYEVVHLYHTAAVLSTAIECALVDLAVLQMQHTLSPVARVVNTLAYVLTAFRECMVSDDSESHAYDVRVRRPLNSVSVLFIYKTAISTYIATGERDTLRKALHHIDANRSAYMKSIHEEISARLAQFDKRDQAIDTALAKYTTTMVANDTCPICLDLNTTKVVQCPTCNNTRLHVSCIRRWFGSGGNSCPVCNTVMM
jgi:hypothetical protein